MNKNPNSEGISYVLEVHEVKTEDKKQVAEKDSMKSSGRRGLFRQDLSGLSTEFQMPWLYAGE